MLSYVQRFDIVPQLNPKVSGSRTHKGLYPEASSMLYVLKHAKRSSGELVGDVVPFHQVRSLVELVPRLGRTADTRLSATNSMVYSTEFWLNKYFTKEFFYAFYLADL